MMLKVFCSVSRSSGVEFDKVMVDKDSNNYAIMNALCLFSSSWSMFSLQNWLVGECFFSFLNLFILIVIGYTVTLLICSVFKTHAVITFHCLRNAYGIFLRYWLLFACVSFVYGDIWCFIWVKDGARLFDNRENCSFDAVI